MCNSPYMNKDTTQWKSITQELICDFPIELIAYLRIYLIGKNHKRLILVYKIKKLKLTTE